ncbi:MAG: hypothetical protein ACUVV3_10295 [Dehalococcoidia bacterium]
MAPEIVGTVKNALMQYGLPLAGFFGGYLAADAFGLQNFITGLVPEEYKSKLDARVWGVVTACIFLGVGVWVWGMWDGIGRFVGALLVGMGVSVIINTLRGK